MSQGRTQMYDWIGKTWSPVAGECPHRCKYCYVTPMKRRMTNIRTKYAGDPHLDQASLHNIPMISPVFVGSCNDIFATAVPTEVITGVLDAIKRHDKVVAARGRPPITYHFQTKNPARYLDFMDQLPPHHILGTTIESDLDYPTISDAPKIEKRLWAMAAVMSHAHMQETTMISIEPIMAMNDPKAFAEAILKTYPTFVSIGADSKGNDLPEPTKEDIELLIKSFHGNTRIKLKNNLSRLGINTSADLPS